MKKSESVLQLENYFLDEVVFEIKSKVFPDNVLDITPHCYLDFDESRARVKLEFHIEEEIFFMRGSLIGTFSYDSGVDEETVRELIAINGVTILFPYLRSTISSISHAANVPTIIIPTINILDYLQNKFEQMDSE